MYWAETPKHSQLFSPRFIYITLKSLKTMIPQKEEKYCLSIKAETNKNNSQNHPVHAQRLTKIHK